MWTAGLCVMLTVCAVTASLTGAWGDAYKKGASGATVTEIQTRLKNWGYYSGEVDGVFGSATEKAVKYFQQKNGLTADGVVGAQTLAALGINGGGGDSSGGTQSGDLYLLARRDLRRGARRAVYGAGGRWRCRAQPRAALVIPEFDLGRDISVRRVFLP